MSEKVVVLTDAVAFSSVGGLDRITALDGPLGPLTDMDQWRTGLGIPQKELKIADRQTLLLLRTLQALLDRNPSIDRDAAAVHLAVGPARTDLEALLKWARRIEPGEGLPLVHPAAAVSLLPNMPLGWVSIRQHWHGEGAVWAGFEEAGFQAVAGAVEALLSGVSEAVVAAISSPESYFVRFVLTDRGLPLETAYPEIGVALRLRLAAPGIDGLRLGGLRETGPAECFGSEGPSLTPLRSAWGNPLVSAFPLALALAWAGRASNGSPAMGTGSEVGVQLERGRRFSARLEAVHG